MLTRRVRLQIVAFVAIALVGVSFAGARYAGLDRLFGPRGYVVTLKLADTGGVFENAEVTYRGVPVGRVGTIELTSTGVNVPLDIESSAPRIPDDVAAVVTNRSAVGEQYVDLQPKRDDGPFLDHGSVITQESATTPLPVETLMTNLDGLANSVPEDSLRTVVSELGTAFRDNGGHLQTIVDTSREFITAAQEHLPQTTKLLDDGNTVLATQNEQGSAIKSFGRDLRLLSEQLERSDGDLRAVIEKAPPAAQQISGLIHENQQLTPLLANLTSTSQLIAKHVDGLEHAFVVYPAAVTVSRTVVPGDGTAHFGLVLNAFDPLPCTAGYEKTERRNGIEMDPVPVNTDARCLEPPGSETSVRGAQNAPGQ
ncbi:phospholipid/cholesterol/gamma-HCH transport system substrate-binding protein [Saccharopolyspora antimicrobica]|uniref:Phospholipid/cholesterol/gamma-HCH transport system substrate-binding protein n=1 Tax=Saccharopolyspora antimicrobica TaxID=455193 RepID=A0A1I5DQH1_9PSEU|nr:MlaD family protein [Saccharopolyspora antimicrobica]RKT85026.1 phospholipid/cholesterol/gamma-HCH transport system substrate-binding protein [Saccharopolyspora antimicrobica]SFO01473.1 phospholipid/cholesterol/gamma-HCH transport system substrate-binding protein [Saccharopolyspora antimicrobica]